MMKNYEACAPACIFQLRYINIDQLAPIYKSIQGDLAIKNTVLKGALEWKTNIQSCLSLSFF